MSTSPANAAGSCRRIAASSGKVSVGEAAVTINLGNVMASADLRLRGSMITKYRTDCRPVLNDV